jgi:hypothetical protein
MPMTYEPIATTTLTTAQSSVTFSSIPGTYTDLVIVCQVAFVTAANEIRLRFNSDSGSNYSYTRLKGNGSSASSDRYSNDNHIHIGSPGNDAVIGNSINQINNYSNTTTYKTVVSRSNFTNRELIATAGTWRSTAAITTVYIDNSGGQNITSGSTFTIYGIKAA